MTRNHLLPATLAVALCAACALPAHAQQGIDRISGDITAEAGRQYGDLETVSGDIELRDQAHLEDASTVSGNIDGGDGVHAESLSSVSGNVKLGEQARISDDIESVSGDIFVGRGGQVGGDVETVSGSIGIVDTDLAAGIETISGDVTVGAGSHVKGSLRVEKSDGFSVSFGNRRPQRIVIGPDAVVEGPMVFERDVVLYVHDSARTGKITGATAIRFSTPTPPED